MASKGNLYLKNSAVIDLYDSTNAYDATVQDALYSQYKIAYKVSKSNYYRGEGADVFKEYITNSTINIISGLMDASSEIVMMIQIFAEAFCQYEKNQNGKVEEQAIDYINQMLNTKENAFNGAKEELNEVLRLAAQYISVNQLALDNVNDSYARTHDEIRKIREDLYAVDDEAAKSAKELFERIHSLRQLIEKVKAFCYSGGKINEENIVNLQNQNWFYSTSKATLVIKLMEDPFIYAAGEVTLTEDQWAKGLCSDVYVYGGYSVYDRSYETGVEDNTAFAKGKVTALKLNGYAQVTNYIRSQITIQGPYVEGEVKAGWNDKYMGGHIEGEIGLAKIEGSTILGSDELNAFVKGEVKVLSADAKAACEFEENGQFAIGVDASATVAAAKATGGINILKYKKKNIATGKEEPLLGFEVEGEVTAGGDFAVWAESKMAIELKKINVNATTIKIKGAAFAGGKVSITVPTAYFKNQW